PTSPHADRIDATAASALRGRFRLPARELRRPVLVLARRAEEDAVEHRALEPDLRVAFPGEADAAVDLGGVASDLAVALRQMALRDRRHARGLGGHVILRVGRVPVE